jgi:hypothetical protein
MPGWIDQNVLWNKKTRKMIEMEESWLEVRGSKTVSTYNDL